MSYKSATPNRLLLTSINPVDPRQEAEPHALVLASHNNYPVVAQARRRSDGLATTAGLGIALLLGGATFWMMNTHRGPQGTPVPVAVSAPPPASLNQVRPSTPVAPAPPLPAPTAAADDEAKANAARSPTLVFDGSQTAAQNVPTATKAPEKPAGSPEVIGGGDNDPFALHVGGTSDVVRAQPMADPGHTVSQGTLIPAVLETAIDTDVPGYARAVVSRDVRSFDGTRVLIPRSSRLIGQYKSGLQAGQTRAYVIWSRLIRPDGVSVALGSPAVDAAGSSGLPGDVNSHFMKRFGSAVLLSVVGGLTALGGNASVVLSGGQSAASVAAQRDTQIPPTIRVPQGQPIRVFTARDLDFSATADAG